MAALTPEQRQLKALAQVRAAVELFQEHLRAKQLSAGGSSLAPLGNPAEKEDGFWAYFSEVDRFRQVGDPTHKAATAIGRAFGGHVRGRVPALAFMTAQGVPLYWATWALAT